MDLKELLGEELFAQVEEKIGDKKLIVNDGNFIPKAKFDELNESRKEYKQMLEERDKQLEKLGKQAKGNEELTEQIKQLQTENEQTEQKYEQRLHEQAFSFALEKAIRDAKAKNPKAVKALLDTETIKLEGEKLIGLDEQLKTVKESDSYLFDEEKPSKGGGEFGGGTEPTENPFGKEHFNLTKQAEIYMKNPELAKHLKSKAK